MQVQQSLFFNCSAAVISLRTQCCLPAQFVLRLKAEFTFGLLLDFRKHGTILSFINNALSEFSFLSAACDQLMHGEPGSGEAPKSNNCFRQLCLRNPGLRPPQLCQSTNQRRLREDSTNRKPSWMEEERGGAGAPRVVFPGFMYPRMRAGERRTPVYLR